VNIQVEMLEVYNENVKDLMGGVDDLKLNDNEPVGSRIVNVENELDVEKILAIAMKKRVSKSTNSNDVSSRSHLIFTILFNAENSRNSGMNRNGKLHICDLCGSERLNKSGANERADLLKETQCINSSLSCLANVVEKLQNKSEHVPFRDSKLTYLLQNSLSGDSKTLAIVCCSPLPVHYHESLCSLRFASRVNRVELKKQEKVTL